MLRLAQGRPKVGLRELEEARRAHSLTQETRFTRLVDTIEARLRLRAGQHDQAVAILSTDGVRGAVDACPVAVELAVLDRDLDEALRWIEVWPDTTDLRPRLDKEIWTAVVDRLCGRRSVAVRRLGAILPEASAEGHVRAFLDGGAPIQSLLRDASQRHDGAFVRRLLSGDGAQPLSGKADSRELSRRELEILQFLPSRLTTAEIADRLFISRNTLKTHLRNIYAKLGVPSREEAIAQAGRRGLA
jgi:LuxR family maltose regulon positive regulatory protein